jgi:hypothetical protein
MERELASVEINRGVVSVRVFAFFGGNIMVLLPDMRSKPNVATWSKPNR